MANHLPLTDAVAIQAPGLVDHHEWECADPRRRTSGEANYGCHWRLGQWHDPWRISVVLVTGEVYAVRLRDDRMFVMGVLQPEQVQRRPMPPHYETPGIAEAAKAWLCGWATDFYHPDGGNDLAAFCAHLGVDVPEEAYRV